MSTATDPAGLVPTFLKGVRPNAKELVDLFGDDFTSPKQSGNRAMPVRVRGLHSQLAEEDRKITRASVWQRGMVTQEFISCNTTAYDSKVQELYRKEEADRSSLLERWYCELSIEDKQAFDDYCLTHAESVVQPCFPPSLPQCLRGPIARLALEYAAIVRRAETERKECERCLANRGQRNRTVVESVLGGLAKVAKEAESRLIGQWFRELTPEQRTVFDSAANPETNGQTPSEQPDNQSRNQGGTGQSEGAGRRGRKRPSAQKQAGRKKLQEDWLRFKEAKSGSKKDFCKDKGIKVKELDRVLAILRKKERESKSAN